METFVAKVGRCMTSQVAAAKDEMRAEFAAAKDEMRAEFAAGNEKTLADAMAHTDTQCEKVGRKAKADLVQLEEKAKAQHQKLAAIVEKNAAKQASDFKKLDAKAQHQKTINTKQRARSEQLKMRMDALLKRKK